ncbi:MAG TPA: hypothetical protein VMS96_14615 [Terriglobales bacterium]|nr:hypothetical protein [Terriglobales bacterium]
MKTGRGALVSDVRGEVETEDGVLVIRRIRVHHRLAVPAEAGDVVREVHQQYPLQCPLYRTLHRCIDISTTYELVPPTSG